jgi:hypothetical protein
MATSTRIPTPGRIVNYHHPVDGHDWPAIILEVTGGPDDDVSVNEPYLCNLQIFRARGNEWRRANEGDEPSHWSWPVMIYGKENTP